MPESDTLAAACVTRRYALRALAAMLTMLVPAAARADDPFQIRYNIDRGGSGPVRIQGTVFNDARLDPPAGERAVRGEPSLRRAGRGDISRPRVVLPLWRGPPDRLTIAPRPADVSDGCRRLLPGSTRTGTTTTR